MPCLTCLACVVYWCAFCVSVVWDFQNCEGGLGPSIGQPLCDITSVYQEAISANVQHFVHYLLVINLAGQSRISWSIHEHRIKEEWQHLIGNMNHAAKANDNIWKIQRSLTNKFIWLWNVRYIDASRTDVGISRPEGQIHPFRCPCWTHVSSLVN